MDFEEFKMLNRKTLKINRSKWLDDHSRLDRTKIPRQVVAPPEVIALSRSSSPDPDEQIRWLVIDIIIEMYWFISPPAWAPNLDF